MTLGRDFANSNTERPSLGGSCEKDMAVACTLAIMPDEVLVLTVVPDSSGRGSGSGGSGFSPRNGTGDTYLPWNAVTDVGGLPGQTSKSEPPTTITRQVSAIMPLSYAHANSLLKLTADFCICIRGKGVLPHNLWALNSAVECHPHTVEVVGSNPTAPTILKTDEAISALARHIPHSRGVTDLHMETHSPAVVPCTPGSEIGSVSRVSGDSRPHSKSNVVFLASKPKILPAVRFRICHKVPFCQALTVLALALL
jgi:hypothetical protein